jgi:prepilin-type processing-associated H-X9-DG protein
MCRLVVPTNGKGGFAQHRPDRANLLFMDGHVEFLKYPGNQFPVTRADALLFGG